ncbi:MAG TPA: hypothetical protein VN513_12315 [Gemmatimonadales bacterium]|nr:hypothetical protein [Gemmatimonadales bacterium]
MPRIRTVKPEFWQDEKMAALRPIDRLVFLGLISAADDAGRLVDSIKFIDGFIFPGTSDSAAESLDVLAGLSRIVRYVSESGQKLIEIAGWHKHQKVDNASKYTLPGPPKHRRVKRVTANGTTRESRAMPERESREPIDQSSRYDLGPTTYDQPPPRARASAPPEFPSRYSADLEQVLLYVTVPESLFATLRSLNSGEVTPPAFSWEEIGLGLHDYVANGKHTQFNARQLRRYVQGAREQLEPHDSTTAAGGQKTARTPMKPDAARAFDEAMKFLRASPGGWLHMTAEQIASVEPATRAAVSAAGGWKELANSDEIGLRMRRKAFIEAYIPQPHEVHV